MATATAKHARNKQLPWSQLWQIPSLLLGVTLLGLGIYLAMPEESPDNFPLKFQAIQGKIDVQKFEEAKDDLDDLLKHMEKGTTFEKGWFQALYGDVLYMSQVEKGWSARENHEKIAQRYEDAAKLKYTVSPDQVQRWADTLVKLGQDQRALQIVESLGEKEAGRQLAVVRALIEKRIDSDALGLQSIGSTDIEQLAPLMSRFHELLLADTDMKRKREASIWLAETDARLRLAANDPQGALDLLLIRYPRLINEGGDSDLASLMIQFGNSYLRTGDFEDAASNFLRATGKMDSSDSRNAEAIYGMAQVEQLGRGNNEKAMAYYQQVVRDYPSAISYLPSLIGLGDVEAKLGAHPEAIEHFAAAIDFLVTRRTSSDPNRERAVAVIQSQYDVNFDRGDYHRALEYLGLLQPLYDRSEDMPSDLLKRFAITHEKFGRKRHEEAEAHADRVESAAARRLANIEAAESFSNAGKFFYLHAQAMAGAADDGQHGESLWRAAMNFDAAQRWDRSITVYSEFVETRGTDPLYLKAMRNLGRAHMSNKDYKVAADLFERLVEEYPKSLETYESLVPLARCHERMGESDHAVRVLKHVVTDHPSITPESDEYREALIELGRIFYKRGDYEDAISRLTEAVDRYGDTEKGQELRYLLADAHRMSAGDIAQQLSEPLPESRAIVLRGERAKRLEEALGLYTQVIDGYLEDPGKVMSEVERLFFRNAFFYCGDCAFDLGRFAEARTMYDRAARRFERDPASLIALVQIVNTWCEEGDFKNARVANERARHQFKNIPDSAFDDPNLPMNRKHWKDWLRWSNELNLFEKQAAVPAPSN